MRCTGRRRGVARAARWCRLTSSGIKSGGCIGGLRGSCVLVKTSGAAGMEGRTYTAGPVGPVIFA